MLPAPVMFMASRFVFVVRKQSWTPGMSLPPRQGFSKSPGVVPCKARPGATRHAGEAANELSTRQVAGSYNMLRKTLQEAG